MSSCPVDQPRNCVPTVARRRLVQAGCLAPLGLSMPGLLAMEEATGRGTRAKSCIFVCQYGGLSQLDSWDPKPQAAAEIRGPYQPIATATPGFQISELMPRLAMLSNDYCVIRSMSHGVPVHDVANRILLSGQSAAPAGAPAFGSIVAKLRPSTANVPSYVWLQKFGGGAAPPEPAYLTGGYLGMNCAPLLIGSGHEDNPGTPGYRVKVFESADDVTPARLQNRWQLLNSLQPQGSVPVLQTLQRHQERAFDLLHGREARDAFDLEKEPPALRDQYGRHPLGQNLLLARRLIESGVRLVSVVAWMGLAPGDTFMSVETWDMHGNAGVSIFGHGWNGLGFALPRADAALAALLQDLKDRGLLDSTLVVMAGEFGRTPKISRGAGAIGRDHWPNCYSVLLAGAGLRGGTVYGASDSQAAWVAADPVSPEDFSATLLHALDIDPGTRLSPDGFTLPASTGQPVMDLF